MGIAQSHDEEHPANVPLPPPRPSLGPRPQNAHNVPFASFRPNSRFMRSVEYLRPVKMGRRVENVFIVPREKIRLVPCSPNSSVYFVEFEFKASVSGTVSVYFLAQERLDLTKIGGDSAVTNVTYSPRGYISRRSSFTAGDTQVFRQRAEDGLDIRRHSETDLKFAHDNIYPLVIRLDASYIVHESPNDASMVKSHITLAEILFVDGHPNVCVVEQKVYIGTSLFSMEDMYGIRASYNASHADQAEAEGDSSAECVVCLTETSTTAVQPCKHLCLCDDCARMLTLEVDAQQKCPVCRGAIGKLLRIIDPRRENSNPDADEAENSSFPAVGATTSSNSVLPSWHPMQHTPIPTVQPPYETSDRESAASTYIRNLPRVQQRGNASNFSEGSTHPRSRMHFE